MSDHHLIKHAHETKQEDKVTLGVKISWGVGGIADNYIMNALNTLVLPIYNIAFHMSPVLLGIALFIPRFIDAVTDPLMGNISDNTRSRWGRRRPYIFIGAVVCAIILPLLWAPPSKTNMAMFIYFTVMSVLYSLGYTAYVVPYTALGYELTNDYDERTRTLAWRMYLGLIAGFAMPWLYKLCLHPVFEGDAGAGARWLSVLMGILIVITGILPAVKGRENVQAAKQKKIGILIATKYTLKNRAFLILVMGYIIVIFSLFTSGTMALYVNIFYIGKGSKEIVSSSFINKATVAIDDTIKAADSFAPESMGDFVARTSMDITSAQLIVAQIMFEGQAEKQAFLDQEKKDTSVPDVIAAIDSRIVRAGQFLDKANAARTTLAAHAPQMVMVQYDENTLVEFNENITGAFDGLDTRALAVEFKQGAEPPHDVTVKLADAIALVNVDVGELKAASTVLADAQVNVSNFKDVIEKAYQTKYSIVRMEHWFVDNEKLAKKLTDKHAFKNFIGAGTAATDKIVQLITALAKDQLVAFEPSLLDKVLNRRQTQTDELVPAFAEVRSIASAYYKRYDPRSFAATVYGYAGTIIMLTSYLSMFLITAVSVKWGKRHGMIVGLVLGCAGSASQIFTLTPVYPYLQLISSFIFGLGMQGCWLMVSSMVADVCDVDEVKTGLRREGMYGAVTGFAQKIAISLTALAGGLLLVVSGFDAKTASFFGNISPDTLFRMKYYFIAVQSVGLLLTIFAFMFYPISRRRAEDVRRILDERKAHTPINQLSGGIRQHFD